MEQLQINFMQIYTRLLVLFLQNLGVKQVLGGDQCSYQQQEEYFSYRRDAKTGRMATFVLCNL